MSEKSESKFILILILGCMTALSPFSIDMYLPAFQAMANEFGTTVAKVSLSLSSYFVGLSFGQLFYGPLLDRFGRKKPIYVGLSLYILTSLYSSHRWLRCGCCFNGHGSRFIYGQRKC